ncbi:MAG: DUF1552 domain-containing protein [Planctomycetia bacterium]
MHLDRRRFLRGAGSIIALPALGSFGFRRFAAAAAASVRPKRMIFIGFGWGITEETWLPDKTQTGVDWALPDGLQPLARHRNQITIVQNTFHQHSTDPHACSTFWLTGANKFGVPGKSFSNTISVDQVAAEQFGRDTRLTSLTLSGPADSHGPGLSLAWNRQGKPVAGLENPVVAFHRLFSDEATSLEKRQADLKNQRSVLDVVLEDARDLERGLSRDDVDKLREYFESIRDIETRLAKEEQWLAVPKAKPAEAMPEPGNSMKGDRQVGVMYDLMVAALQTEATRVATYRQPAQLFIDGLGIPFNGHNLSHYTPGPRMEASQVRDRGMSTVLAHLIDRLKAVKEPDGSSLFDHTSVVFGSNVRSQHYLENCPTLLTGGGAGIKLGHHVVLADPKTPLCNVFLTLLKGVGIETPSFGDSTGIIDELMA